jgi:mitochondrial pyruvate carrier 1
MTGALIIYSATFMRYALAVTPKNYLLFACHFINEGAQLTQGYRFLQYHNWGGKEKMLNAKVEEGMGDVKVVAGEATEKARDLVEKAREKVGK